VIRGDDVIGQLSHNGRPAKQGPVTVRRPAGGTSNMGTRVHRRTRYPIGRSAAMASRPIGEQCWAVSCRGHPRWPAHMAVLTCTDAD
jgi:hypothetical protein